MNNAWLIMWLASGVILSAAAAPGQKADLGAYPATAEAVVRDLYARVTF
jgi:hypothetical protein